MFDVSGADVNGASTVAPPSGGGRAEGSSRCSAERGSASAPDNTSSQGVSAGSPHAAVVSAECRRIAVLLDALGTVLNSVPGAMPAVTMAFDAAGVPGERWPDGGLSEQWLRGELEQASATLIQAHAVWQMFLLRQEPAGA